jgi:hypothetical protein
MKAWKLVFAFAMLLSIAFFFGVSLLSERPQLDPDIEAVINV